MNALGRWACRCRAPSAAKRRHAKADSSVVVCPEALAIANLRTGASMCETSDFQLPCVGSMGLKCETECK